MYSYIIPIDNIHPSVATIIMVVTCTSITISATVSAAVALMDNEKCKTPRVAPGRRVQMRLDELM